MIPGARAARLLSGRALPPPLLRWGRAANDFFCLPVAGIVLVRNGWLGALIWLALAAQPRLLLAGAAGIVVGEAVRRAIGVDEISCEQGCLKANAFLAAVALGWMTGFAELGLAMQGGLVAGAAALAAVLAAAVRRALDTTTLPPFVLAYCLVAGFAFLVFPEWALRAITALDWGHPPVSAADWGLALLRALGALVFVPTPWTGLIMAAVILAWSRLMFVCGLIGWIAGVLMAKVFLSLGEVYYWLPSSYNFFLAGMALGATHYLPSRASPAIAAAAGAFASVVALGLQALFSGSPAAYLPIAFALAVWVGMAALFSAEQRGLVLRNASPALPPEDAWRDGTLHVLRWGHREPLLGVPLAGAAEVTQGFSGRLSHLGRWCHALDLQRPGAQGSRPSLWEAPVYAPAAGIVVRVRNDVADNALGVSNFQENWGNHVVIRLDQGGWAMLAHLRQWSSPLGPGMRVAPGTFLGLVGNSGRSPTPHLHLQAQRDAEPGAMTTGFRLANYLAEPAPGEGLLRWHPAGVPAEGAVVAAALPDPAVRALLTGMVPGDSLWSVEVAGRVPPIFAPVGHGSESIEVLLDEQGRHHHVCNRGEGRIVSRADADAWRTLSVSRTASPLLRLMAVAMPSIPYAAFPGMTWRDHTPLLRPARGGILAASLAPFGREPFVAVECRCIAKPSAEGGRLVLHCDVLNGGPGLPVSIVAELEAARGCVSLKAAFHDGFLTFGMLSFAPGLPFRDAVPGLVGSAADGPRPPVSSAASSQ